MTCFLAFAPKRDEKDLSSPTELREEMEGSLSSTSMKKATMMEEFDIDEGDDGDGRKARRHYWNVMLTVGLWSICCRWRPGGRVRQQR